MNHATLVSLLKKPGDTIADSISPAKADLLHMGIGLSGEVGELLDSIKRHCIYSQPLDLVNLIEELGDIEFYLEGLRQNLGISREETIGNNIAKLSKRYPNLTYTDTHAKERLDKQ